MSPDLKVPSILVKQRLKAPEPIEARGTRLRLRAAPLANW